MISITNGLITLIAVLHLYFLVLEMFLWTTPFGLKTFGQNLELAKSTAVLAANQGLYNGFLAAGLIWGLLHSNLHSSYQIKMFFLACIIVAGIYGAWSTGNIKILFIQALPAATSVLLIIKYFKLS